jgi:hypothetical protein
MNNIIETLEKIESAKRVTASVLGRTSEFATYVSDTMVALGVSSLLGGKYKVRTLKTSYGHNNTSLYLRVAEFRYVLI